MGATVATAAPTELQVRGTATVSLAPGDSIGQVQGGVEASIEADRLTVRQGWATMIGTTNVQYQANVYLARVISAMISVTGIINATNVQLNGAASDLILTETGTTQQIPILGTVTLSE